VVLRPVNDPIIHNLLATRTQQNKVRNLATTHALCASIAAVNVPYVRSSNRPPQAISRKKLLLRRGEVQL